MKRSGRGMHPVILAIVSSSLLLTLSLVWLGVWFLARQASAEATAAAAMPPAPSLTADLESGPLPTRNRPAGLLMEPSVRLAYCQEAERGLRAPIGVLCFVFLASLVWARQPRTS